MEKLTNKVKNLLLKRLSKQGKKMANSSFEDAYESVLLNDHLEDVLRELNVSENDVDLERLRDFQHVLINSFR